MELENERNKAKREIERIRKGSFTCSDCKYPVAEIEKENVMCLGCAVEGKHAEHETVKYLQLKLGPISCDKRNTINSELAQKREIIANSQSMVTVAKMLQTVQEEVSELCDDTRKAVSFAEFTRIWEAADEKLTEAQTATNNFIGVTEATEETLQEVLAGLAAIRGGCRLYDKRSATRPSTPEEPVVKKKRVEDFLDPTDFGVRVQELLNHRWFGCGSRNQLLQETFHYGSDLVSCIRSQSMLRRVMVDKQLAAEPWYHGLLPREDIKTMLRFNGDFLVRSTEPVAGQQRQFVLSVMFKQEMEDQGIKHFVISRLQNNKFSIEKYVFDSVSCMIDHHLATRDSVAKFEMGPEGLRPMATDIVLRTPILRQTWELQHDDVDLTKKLGEGAFGEVHMGKLKHKGCGKVSVAVKLAKLEVLTKEQIKEIMREARLMRNFDHPNVVKFYGVAAGQEPLMVIMELANQGALDSYLQKHEQSMDKKSEMILQASWGLEYLHFKQVLHRDIAARNCLYGDGKVKISDFGLTREGTVYQMDPSKRVPIRWLAPETIKTYIYTQKTDVFSYGVMSWEILNNGIEPYPGMTVAEVAVQVRDGYRMELPPNLQPEVAHIIKSKCWSENPNDRFTMADISKHLERILRIPKPDFGGNNSGKELRRKRRSKF